MMNSHEDFIRAGYQAIKRGNKGKARRLMEEAAELNPADYRVWLGLAAAARTPRESLTYIDKAAELNPNNPAVSQARQWAENQIKEMNKEKAAAAAIAASSPTAQQPTVKGSRKAGSRSARRRQASKESGFQFGLALRRVFGVAAILAILILLGFGAWTAYLAYMGDWAPVANNENGGEGTPPTAEAVANAPQAEVSNIVPEEAPGVVETAVENTATPNPIQPKNIVQSDSNPRPRWTETPLPTQTPTPSPTWVPTFVSPLSQANILKPVGLLPSERWIDVSLSTQSLVAYEGDTPVFDTLVSTGMAQYPTVTGQFRIWLRFPSQTMDGSRLGYDYYLEDVPFVQYFFEDYALHGTYWHNNFGYPMSHGCVNLSNADAEWLYNFADYGTVVYVHE